MTWKRVPLFAVLVLGAAIASTGAAVAQDDGDDSQCSVIVCNDGVNSARQCRTYAGNDCNMKCNDLECDGGSDATGPFNCGNGPWKLCQCGACGSGGSTDPDPGPGGGGIGGHCDEYNCWMDCFYEYSCTGVVFESYCDDGVCQCEIIEYGSTGLPFKTPRKAMSRFRPSGKGGAPAGLFRAPTQK